MKNESATPPHRTRVATARTALAAFVVVATGCRAPLDERVSSIDPRAYVGEVVEFVRANFYGERQLVEPLLVEASQRGERAKDLADAKATVRWLIRSLDDPHTFVSSPAVWAGMEGGEVFATGVEVSSDCRFVTHVHPGSPAAEAGLTRGMHILGGRGTATEPADTDAFRRLVSYGRGANGDVETVTLWVQDAEASVRIVELDVACISVLQMPEGRMIAPGIAYLELPTCPSLGAAGEAYAQRAHDEIARLCGSPGVRGWVLDLRRCRGGNGVALRASVAPFLGHGPVGGESNRNGLGLYVYRDGCLFGRGWMLLRVARPAELAERTPIAVLISQETASGGEAALLGLVGASGVASFGRPTRGLTSAVKGTWLPDGSTLQVACGWMTTNRLDEAAGPQRPHFEVDVDWAAFGGDRDPTLLAAVSWIFSQ